MLFLFFDVPTRPTVSQIFSESCCGCGIGWQFRYRHGSTVGNLAASSVTRGGIRICVSYGYFLQTNGKVGEYWFEGNRWSVITIGFVSVLGRKSKQTLSTAIIDTHQSVKTVEMLRYENGLDRTRTTAASNRHPPTAPTTKHK